MNTIQPRLHLTVTQRAILSLFFTALLTGGYTAVDAISNPSNVDWHTIIIIAIVTSVGTFGHTAATYLSTHGYLPLGTIVEAETTAAEKRYAPSAQPARQFVVIPPGSTTRAEPIALPVQTVPPMTQGNTPPSDAMGGTTLVPIVPPPPTQQ